MSRAAFTLTWDDPNDAREVAHVLESAALHNGQVRDHGFHDDAMNLLRQVEEYERDEEFFDD